jgi:hypothetical protein
MSSEWPNRTFAQAHIAKPTDTPSLHAKTTYLDIQFCPMMISNVSP